MNPAESIAPTRADGDVRRPPLLTIGIPTFDGRAYLEATVAGALEQMADRPEVELLVCDNASTDGTADYMERLVARHPRVRYVRHAVNQGMDRNFWSVAQSADGRFVHFLGDDDFYRPGALARLLEVLEAEDPDAVLLSNDYLNMLNDRFILNGGDGEADRLCTDAAGFYEADRLKSLCLSNVVLKTDRCRRAPGVERFIGRQWLHLAMLLATVGPSSRTFVFSYARPLVTIRIGNQRWLDRGGAVAYYLDALGLYHDLIVPEAAPVALPRYRQAFLTFFRDGRKMKFDDVRKNLRSCFRLVRYYHDQPIVCLKLVARILLLKRRPFFTGWDTIGSPR